MEKLSLKDKIKDMSTSDIIRCMVEGLKKEYVEKDMSSYGHIKEGICFGCAATNFICNLYPEVIIIYCLPILESGNIGFSYSAIFEDKYRYIRNVELLINKLRRGNILDYNYMSNLLNLPLIPIKFWEYKLPALSDNYTTEQLEEYLNFANLLEDYSK